MSLLARPITIGADFTLPYLFIKIKVKAGKTKNRTKIFKLVLLVPAVISVYILQLRFFYHMWGRPRRVGSLRVRLQNTITGVISNHLWQISGYQGNQWHRAVVPIATSWPVVQVCYCGCCFDLVLSCHQ